MLVVGAVTRLLGIPLVFDGAAGLTSDSTLSASATRVHLASASLSADGAVTATATYVGVASAALTADGSLSAAGTRVQLASCAMSVESAVSAAGTIVQPGASIIVGTSSLTAAGTRVALGSASLSAQSGASATGTRVALGSSALTGEVTLSASVHYRVNADAAMTVASELTVSVLPIYRLLDPTSEVVYTDILPLSRYGIDSGKTIVINGTDLLVTEYPMQDELADADFYFLGGHKYQLSQTEYEAFVACGRSDLVEVA